MAGNLSPKAQIKLASLREMSEKIASVYAMTERYAGTRDERQAEQLAPALKRSFGRLKLQLMGAGLDTLSQLAGAMEIAAGRGGSVNKKARILREGVGSLKFQVDMEQRKVISEDEAERAREAEQAGS